MQSTQINELAYVLRVYSFVHNTFHIQIYGRRYVIYSYI